MERIIGIFLLVLFLTSCKKETSKHPSVFIDFQTKESKFFTLNELTSYLKLIPLETNDSALIKRLKKIQTFKNKIYILDSGFDNVYVFNESGNFERKIGKRGHGPGEYVDIGDFELDTVRKRIVLLSVELGELLEYSLPGEFIRKIKLPIKPTQFRIVDGKYYAFYNSFYDVSRRNLYFTDLDGNILDSFFRFPSNSKSMDLTEVTGNMSDYDGKILYTEPSDAQIYEVELSNPPREKYEIDMRSKVWDEDQKYDFNAFFKSLNRGEIAYLGSTFYETDELLFFTYILPLTEDVKSLRKRKAIFNKRFKVLYLEKIFRNDPLFRLMSAPLNVDASGLFTSKLEIWRLKDKQNGSLVNQSEELKKLAEKMNSNSNPVLVQYRFKLKNEDKDNNIYTNFSGN
ncbi:hypothetical protein L21SP5_01724 [Salinivirga cyanobacteriivorans]|uniref:6-bladed beta-propeller n=1 Tax=Salinivirga cyanobacteriivorans TaxID=1307839 RepID=A0A0S2HZD6_9BACT|nr:6-bladed beta-propeller [Salinivirga cyanobacteriivorans]ALO15366.1 hypothetical protein L21SP5_01724 [Salinivirga cyanobacteriivorans]